MKESPLGFSYSWQDIKPVRGLFVVTLVAQLVGAGVCLWIAPQERWFDNLWLGAALCTFPGYLVGIPIQGRMKPKCIEENIIIVKRMGLVAFALTIAAIVFPRIGLIHAL